MTFQNKGPEITVWRSSAFTGRRWRWHLKAANGAKIGQQAQGNGFLDKRDAIANLEEVLGGIYTETFDGDANSVATGERVQYRQGALKRVRLVDVDGVRTIEPETIFVQVHG